MMELYEISSVELFLQIASHAIAAHNGGHRKQAAPCLHICAPINEALAGLATVL